MHEPEKSAPGDNPARVVLKTRDRILFGVVLPNVLLVVIMLLLANVDSAAHAAEFAGLAVFFMLLAGLPVTVFICPVILDRNNTSHGACFRRGMLPPGVVILMAAVYQTGLWDTLT